MAEANIPVAYGTPVVPVGSSFPVIPADHYNDYNKSSYTPPTPTTPTSRVSLPQQSEEATPLSHDALQNLLGQGYTQGLAQSLTRNKLALPLRIWVIDNSGSMRIQDGHRMVPLPNGQLKPVPCTRWTELQETAEYHAQMAALLQAPTAMRLLNNPGRLAGPQHFSVAERGEAMIDEDLAVATATIQNTAPGGVTPLVEHLNDIYASVAALAPSLRTSGAKVAIVLATDGLPSDSQGYTGEREKADFERALRRFQGLPVWIVVRLCTDDEQVVEFWNNVDGEFELDVEVLDDFVAEAKEIYEHNKWLNYGLPLHRMREMGFHDRVFDLLDESKLSKDELWEFLVILFGAEKMSTVTSPHVDWKAFIAGVAQLNSMESWQWDPRTRRMKPWINMKKLKRSYGPRSPLTFLWKALGY